MGSRATDKLREIEELRDSLGDKIGEIERRFPLAGFGRKAAALVAGGSAGGSVVAFILRRLRRGRRRAKAAKGALETPSVTVNVFPRGATWIAAIGVAAWAGARVYEALARSRSTGADESRPAVLKPMPEAGRRTGAGS